MALPGSGNPISFSQIQTEFGGSNPIGLNEYVRSGTYVPNNSYNANIPTSASNMALNGFYGSSAVTPGTATLTSSTTWTVPNYNTLVVDVYGAGAGDTASGTTSFGGLVYVTGAGVNTTIQSVGGSPGYGVGGDINRTGGYCYYYVFGGANYRAGGGGGAGPSSNGGNGTNLGYGNPGGGYAGYGGYAGWGDGGPCWVTGANGTNYGGGMGQGTGGGFARKTYTKGAGGAPTVGSNISITIAGARSYTYDYWEGEVHPCGPWVWYSGQGLIYLSWS